LGTFNLNAKFGAIQSEFYQETPTHIRDGFDLTKEDGKERKGTEERIKKGREFPEKDSKEKTVVMAETIE
jgi:hypothetical protein